MKFVLRVILVVILCATIPMIALATTSASKTFTVTGYIGKVINVTISAGDNLTWYADDSSGWQVTADNYKLINNNNRVAVNVALVGFEQNLDDNIDATSVENDLTLILTGDLAITNNPDLSGGWTGNEIFGGRQLEYEDDWTFSFGGEYTGTPPTNTLLPHYDMTFEFDVDD